MRGWDRLVRFIGGEALLLLTMPSVSTAAPTVPGSGLYRSVHDFSRSPAPTGEPVADACTFCHLVPVASDPSARPLETGPTQDRRLGMVEAVAALSEATPLWNQDLTRSFAAYAMYQNGPGAPTRGAKASQAIRNGMTPGSTSLVCLGCHDGSVAGNIYGNGIGANGYLGNHHPIGFDYDAVQAEDAEIRFADTATLGRAGLVREHLYGPGNVRMECGTCHAVHNTGNTGEVLLWRSDARSRLCLTCHDKGDNPGMTSP